MHWLPPSPLLMCPQIVASLTTDPYFHILQSPVSFNVDFDMLRQCIIFYAKFVNKPSTTFFTCFACTHTVKLVAGWEMYESFIICNQKCYCVRIENIYFPSSLYLFIIQKCKYVLPEFTK